MADAVTSNVVKNSATHYIIHLTNISDGTGESGVIKVDKSTLVASDGAEPASLDIDQVRWAVQGFTSVRILWDHTTDDTALVLTGNGYDTFRNIFGNDIQPVVDFMNGSTDRSEGLLDPRSTGGTGDILLTTNGGGSGSTYDITLWLRKNPV